MSLLVRNIQKKVRFNTTRFEDNLQLLRTIALIQHYDIGVLCADDNFVQYLNRKYRNVDEPTDVLSFRYSKKSEYFHPPDEPPPDYEFEPSLGDLVFGMPYIERGAKELDMYIQNYLVILATHGICHLLEYDHETKEQYRQMYNKEMYILEKYNEIRKTNLEPFTQSPPGNG